MKFSEKTKMKIIGGLNDQYRHREKELKKELGKKRRRNKSNPTGSNQYIERLVKRISTNILVDLVKEEIGCMECGNKTLHPISLDFHHIQKKKCSISFLNSMGLLDKMLEEMQKCIVVCANCHRVKSHKRIW